MKSKKIWFVIACTLVFLVLLFISKEVGERSSQGTLSRLKNESTSCQSQNQAAGMKTEDRGNILFWEPKDDSLINDGRTREEIAVISLFFLIDFLIIIFSRLFSGGRTWGVIWSFCMTFQGYTMRKLCILQAQDGKKEPYFYFVS